MLGFVLVLACGAVLGLVTEIVTVRPVLKSIEQHLYVLSTLAFALMMQQVTAIEWGTEAQPFPRLIPIGAGLARPEVLAAAAGLRRHHRRAWSSSTARR